MLVLHTSFQDFSDSLALLSNFSRLGKQTIDSSISSVGRQRMKRSLLWLVGIGARLG